MANKIYAQYRDWQGSAEELAALAEQLLTGLKAPNAETTERMVRFYVQERVIARPAREGRRALFSYRQLLQLLATKQLAGKLPLGVIAQHLHGLTDTELLELAPKAARDAQEQTDAPAVAAVLERSTAQVKAQMSLQEDLRRLGNPAGDLTQAQVTEITLAPGCRLNLDGRFLSRLTTRDADALASAVRTTLLHALQARSPKGGERRSSGLTVPAPLPGTRKLVLFVNDQPDADLDVWAWLLGRGAAVLRAHSTREAMTLFERHHADVVITDLARDEGQTANPTAGLDLIKSLRDAGAQLPIVVYTNNKPQGVHDLVTHAGNVAITESPDELRQWLEAQGI